MSFSPFLDLLKYFVYVITSVEFGTLGKSGEHMVSYSVPSDRYHQFQRLNHVSFSFRHHFSEREPDQLMVRGQIQPKFVQGY
jgi:hypothetical protein